MAEGAVKSVWLPIVKTTDNDDGTVTVRGKASSEAVDYDDQIVDRGLMRRLIPRYMQGWKNVRVGHSASWPAGTAVDAEWDDEGDPVLTVRVIEPDAARMVREGVLQGLSVNIAEPKIRPDTKARRGRIYDGREIGEISLVDRPSNPDSKIDIVKAAGWDGAAVPTGWLSSDTASTVGGNVHDPSEGNSGDFDSLGDPVLQPAHVRSNAADIAIITMDTRGAVVQVGEEQYLVPYTVESDGDIHWGEPQPMPHDPRAEPLPPAAAPRQQGAKGAGAVGASYAYTPQEGGVKAAWSAAQVDELPDSAFAYVSPGGRRKDGRTEPRSLRHLPYRDKEGNVDPDHVRNALARLDQTDIPAEAKARAREKLDAAAKEVGIDVSEGRGAARRDIRKAVADALKDSAHCPECDKMVKCGEKVSTAKAPGGEHVLYKGECGHMVHRFEKGGTEGPKSAEDPKGADAPKAAEPPAQEPKAADATPTGLGPDAGTAKGNTTGERPPHTDPAERQENDLVRRMRAALDDYAAGVRADIEGKPGGERAETAALQKLWHDVGAALAIQRREATDPETGADPKTDGTRGQDDEGQIEKAAAALLKRMGFSSRDIAKGACTRHKDGLREAVKRLTSHIEEIPDDPLEHHHSEKSAFGTGAPKKPGDAPDGNDGGPAIADARDWRERIREDLAEVDELMRDVEDAEDALVKGRGSERGRLVRDGRAEMPDAKPGATGAMDLRNAGEQGAPARGTREIPKGAAMGTPDFEGAIEAAIQKGAALGAEAATKAASGAMEGLLRRLEAVEHVARTPNPPVQIAEPPAAYATPWQQMSAEKGVRDGIAEQWNGLPTSQQDDLLARMIAAARGRPAALAR